ncbi:MAG: TIGR00725 family protein [Spirochaetota bacterium]|nr:TIGR00725 family protein [Spirochaetota bacterium]
MRKIQVVVIGNNAASDEEKKLAYETGKIIGESGAVLITGGKRGVMKHSSRGAKECGGMVLSILPDTEFDAGHEYADIVIPTGIGYGRNLVNVLSGDLVVAIAGGAGTLSELAYAWQYKKTIFAFSCGGWSQRLGELGVVDEKHNKRIVSIDSLSDFERQYFDWIARFRSGD